MTRIVNNTLGRDDGVSGTGSMQGKRLRREGDTSCSVYPVSGQRGSDPGRFMGIRH